MQSRFADKCKHCRLKYARGAEIHWLGRGKGAVHSECEDAYYLANPKAAEPQDEPKAPAPPVTITATPANVPTGFPGPTLDMDVVKSMIQDAPKAHTRTITVERYEKPPVTVKRAHERFDRVLYYVARRRSVYLWGPAGTGKSHMAMQIAQALELPYAYVSLNPQSSASKLEGFLDAQGRFTSPDFHRLYANGGVFCLDECDNASPSVLTTLNSALANGMASFPSGMVKRHPDFVLIATGNTTGRGGDWQYPERRKLDEATLDRLTFVEIRPDRALEMSLAKDVWPKAEPWVEWVWKLREFVADRQNGIKGGVYATQRAILAGAEDLGTGPKDLTVSEIAESLVFKGLDRDAKTRILNSVPLPKIMGRAA